MYLGKNSHLNLACFSLGFNWPPPKFSGVANFSVLKRLFTEGHFTNVKYHIGVWFWYKIKWEVRESGFNSLLWKRGARDERRSKGCKVRRVRSWGAGDVRRRRWSEPLNCNDCPGDPMILHSISKGGNSSSHLAAGGGIYNSLVTSHKSPASGHWQSL